jgi:hypothetical protein
MLEDRQDPGAQVTAVKSKGSRAMLYGSRHTLTTDKLGAADSRGFVDSHPS